MAEISITRAMRTGIAWNTINALFSQAIGFLIFLALARVLEPQFFGAIALSALLADFVAVDARYAGMDAILQRGDFSRSSLNSAFITLLLVAAPMSMLLIGLAPVLALYESEPLVSYYMPIFGLLVLFTPWLSVMDALIMRDLGFKTLAKRNMMATVVGGAGAIAIALSPWAIWALPAQRVLFTLTAVLFEFAHTGWRPGILGSAEARRDIFSRFAPLWLIAAINLSMQRAATLVFGIRFDGATVGLVRAADRIGESLQNPIISPLFALWFPLMAKVRGNQKGEAKIYTSIIQTSAFVSLPTFAGVAIVAPDIVAVLLPQTYADVAPILRAVAITCLMIPVVWFNPIAMNALGLNRLSLGYSAAVAVTSIVTLLAVPMPSPAATILVMSAPALLWGIFGNFLITRHLGIGLLAHYAGLLPAVLATLAMGLATAGLHDFILKDFAPEIRLILSSLTGSILYFCLLMGFARQWTTTRISLLIGRGDEGVGSLAAD